MSGHHVHLLGPVAAYLPSQLHIVFAATTLSSVSDNFNESSMLRFHSRRHRRCLESAVEWRVGLSLVGLESAVEGRGGLSLVGTAAIGLIST